MSTVKSSQLNAVSTGARAGAAAAVASGSAPVAPSDDSSDVKFCALDNPECEACQ
jgi:ribonucleoside-diphosphate reductase alpha chain